MICTCILKRIYENGWGEKHIAYIPEYTLTALINYLAYIEITMLRYTFAPINLFIN